MYNQIHPYFQTIFSKFHREFWKDFNSQYFLLVIVEKWGKTLDEGSETETALTYSSKAFDCIDHNLLLAKLSAYGLEKQPGNFIYSYLTKLK